MVFFAPDGGGLDDEIGKPRWPRAAANCPARNRGPRTGSRPCTRLGGRAVRRRDFARWRTCRTRSPAVLWRRRRACLWGGAAAGAKLSSLFQAALCALVGASQVG